MDLFDRLSLALPRLRLLREEPLAAHTSFRIGGPAEVMAFPSSLAELQALLRLSAQEGIRVRLLGAGTNILAPDGGVRGLVIVTSGALTGLSMPDAAHIEAMSGVTMARLACFARDNGLTGLEFAHGIPGTVGGGVYMNAGAYGGEIRAVCRWSQEMLPDGTLVRREGVSQGFGYRTSVFQHTDGVIVRACFALQPGDPGHHPRDDARADDAPHRLAAAGPAFGRERLQAPAGRLCRRAHRVCRAEGPDGRRRAGLGKTRGLCCQPRRRDRRRRAGAAPSGAAARSGAQRHPARAGNSPLGLRNT